MLLRWPVSSIIDSLSVRKCVYTCMYVCIHLPGQICSLRLGYVVTLHYDSYVVISLQLISLQLASYDRETETCMYLQ